MSLFIALGYTSPNTVNTAVPAVLYTGFLLDQAQAAIDAAGAAETILEGRVVSVDSYTSKKVYGF